MSWVFVDRENYDGGAEIDVSVPAQKFFSVRSYWGAHKINCTKWESAEEALRYMQTLQYCDTREELFAWMQKAFIQLEQF